MHYQTALHTSLSYRHYFKQRCRLGQFNIEFPIIWFSSRATKPQCLILTEFTSDKRPGICRPVHRCELSKYQLLCVCSEPYTLSLVAFRQSSHMLDSMLVSNSTLYRRYAKRKPAYKQYIEDILTVQAANSSERQALHNHTFLASNIQSSCKRSINH